MAAKRTGINLSGRWRVVYSELDGEMTPVAHFSGIEIEYMKNKFRIFVHGVLQHAGTFSINQRTKPAQITYVYEKSTFYDVGKPRVGIVQLTGDTFKDCLGAIGAKPPASFNTHKDSELVLTIHQRAGAEGGSGLAVSFKRNVSEW
jgi:uncharacterized protein (TIGR03067 family)